jgi:hypothetical protein
LSCHGREVAFERKDIKAKYKGFPLHLLLAYADDPLYAPHKQGSDILAYDAAAARAGYGVEVIARTATRSGSIRGTWTTTTISFWRCTGSRIPLDPMSSPLVLVWDKKRRPGFRGYKECERVPPSACFSSFEGAAHGQEGRSGLLFSEKCSVSYMKSPILGPSRLYWLSLIPLFF